MRDPLPLRTATIRVTHKPGGEGGQPVTIGIEYKHLTELVQALRTGRLQGYQMPGMREQFDYSYLLIEGELLYDHHGKLLRRKGRTVVPLEGQMTVSELLKRINVLHLCGGLNPLFALTRRDTIQAIAALYHTWTDCDLDQHKSHIAIYNAPPLVPISKCRAAIQAWPGVGLHLSKAVEETFGTLARATSASVDEWANLKTIDEHGKARRLGTKTAERIVAFCQKSTS